MPCNSEEVACDSDSRTTKRGLTAASAAAIFALAISLFVSGCNATEGFGKDLEETGDNIEDAARDAKD